jgi:lysozyme family protein
VALFDVAYKWMQAQEDAADLHATVPDRCPKGCTLDHCYAISGINSGAWPDEFAAIQRLQQDQRGPAVEKFYYVNFWGTHGDSWYAQLTSEDLCKRVFDFAVNAGSVAAVRCLQEAINFFYLDGLIVDGIWGLATIKAANNPNCAMVEAENLVAAFKMRRVAYYRAIVAANPADAVYLAAWTARALR